MQMKHSRYKSNKCWPPHDNLKVEIYDIHKSHCFEEKKFTFEMADVID